MAIINHTKKFIFIHIPKTAGTSVSHYLSQFIDESNLETIGSKKTTDAPLKLKRLVKHSSSREIQARIGKEIWDRYYKIAFVRHPYSRAFSLFTFLKRKHRNWRGSEIMDTFNTFNDFVHSAFFQTHGPDRVFNNQVFWLLQGEHNLGVDFLGQMESIDEHFGQIRKQLNPTSQGENLTKKNISSKQNEISEIQWTPSLCETLNEKYNLDFQLLPYKMGPLNLK